MALSTLLRSPGVTAVTIATLALGIGANTAIFSLLNTVVLRPLPVPHPEQLVSLGTTIPDSANGEEPFSLQMFQELQRQRGAFSDIFSWRASTVTNFEAEGRHVAAVLAAASGNYYRAMGVAPFLGRFLENADVALASGSSGSVAVISYRAWQSWYRARPDIVGATLRIEDQPFTIIGVEPESYTGLIIDGSADVTVPVFAGGLEQSRMNLRDPRLLWLRLYARMKPGVTLAQARASMQALWPAIQDATKPPGYEGARRARFYARRVSLDSAANGVSSLRKRFAQPLRVLLALVGAVLLIACLNLTNLSLAKSVSRQSASATRAALGARSRDLIRPALVESFILSFTGALFGLLLAYWSSRALLHMAWTGLVETHLTARLDLRVLGFTALVAVLAALIAAIVPGWYAAKIDPIIVLRQHTRSVHGGSSVAGRIMLTLQIALSLVLVVGALLFGTTLTRFYSIDPGFRRDHLLSLTLFPQAGKRESGNTNAYYRELVSKVSGIPGVTNASYSSDSPASGTEWRRPVSRYLKSDPLQAVECVVSPGFFATVGMKIVGRDFRWDEDAKTITAAIISRSLAERLFGRDDPIGQEVFWGPAPYQERLHVIAVVNSASLWKVESVKPLALYRSALQDDEYGRDFALDVRTAVDPQTIKLAAESTVRAFGHHYSLQTMTIDERLESYITVQRLTAMLASFFRRSSSIDCSSRAIRTVVLSGRATND